MKSYHRPVFNLVLFAFRYIVCLFIYTNISNATFQVDAFLLLNFQFQTFIFKNQCVFTTEGRSVNFYFRVGRQH